MARVCNIDGAGVQSFFHRTGVPYISALCHLSDPVQNFLVLLVYRTPLCDLRHVIWGVEDIDGNDTVSTKLRPEVL